MNYGEELLPASVLHWNYRGFTEFPIERLHGEEHEITDIYLKENLISRIPSDIGKFEHLESLYLSGNDISELPREISKLRCLKCLDVSGNRLKYVPEEIGEVRGLKFLILDENELSELPLRIAELRSLRYLSVCDNKLKWLPQRPVYNYHHCEFRFWRNFSLKTIPYSLWYHMFRDQQTRSLNIGCLNIPKYRHITNNNRCRLKITYKDLNEWEVDVDFPPKHINVLVNDISPASLLELSKRRVYEMISNTAKDLSSATESFSIYSDNTRNEDFENNNNITNLEYDFGEFSLDNVNGNRIPDLNGNSLQNNIEQDDNFNLSNCKKEKRKKYYVSSDIIEMYFDFLPSFIRYDLSNGPISRCENVSCKRPVFDYVLYEFCVGKIILIDNAEDIILSAAFCSKPCAEIWKRGKNVLSWTLVKDT